MSIRNIKYDEVSLIWAHFCSTVSLLIDRCMGSCMKGVGFRNNGFFLMFVPVKAHIMYN